MAGLVGEERSPLWDIRNRGAICCYPTYYLQASWRQGWDPGCSMELPGDPQMLELSSGQRCCEAVWQGRVVCGAVPLWFRLACWASIAILGLPMALAGAPFQVAVPCDTVHVGAMVA